MCVLGGAVWVADSEAAGSLTTGDEGTACLSGDTEGSKGAEATTGTAIASGAGALISTGGEGPTFEFGSRVSVADS